MIAEFFKEKGWKYEVSEFDNPYTQAHHIKGTSLWSHISQFPDRLANLNQAMLAATSSTIWTVGIFPFEAELSRLHTDDDTVLLVDIGGGMGQAVRQIKEMCPNIKGRMILQDRPQVTSVITGEMPGIEVMAYDFFTPQPIKGTLSILILLPLPLLLLLSFLLLLLFLLRFLFLLSSLSLVSSPLLLSTPPFLLSLLLSSSITFCRYNLSGY
jgi:hypothetical protein